MIERPTVFVLGAGASEPYGFPLGRGLVDEAVQLLRRDERAPRVAMLQEVCGCSRAELVGFADALERAAVPSIDAFLESRDDYLPMGKAVIAALLIPYENEDELFTRVITPQRRTRRWYDYVLNRMGTKAEDFTKNALSVVTFNYDRSLEQFMLVALQNRYAIGVTQAAQLMDALPIIHLHGQLGSLGALDIAVGTRPYLPNVAPTLIRLAAAAISVVHEDVQDHPQFVRAKELLLAAHDIWFLGFGYYGRNVERLGQENFTTTVGTRRNLKLVGTAYNLAAAERTAAMRLVSRGLAPGLSLQDHKWDVLTLLREMWV